MEATMSNLTRQRPEQPALAGAKAVERYLIKQLSDVRAFISQYEYYDKYRVTQEPKTKPTGQQILVEGWILDALKERSLNRTEIVAAIEKSGHKLSTNNNKETYVGAVIWRSDKFTWKKIGRRRVYSIRAALEAERPTP